PRREQRLAVEALPPAHDGREQRHARAWEVASQPLDDLALALGRDGGVAARAVLDAELREQEPKIVVDLGDRGDRRGAPAPREALLDRDRRRQPGEDVDV